MVGFPQGNSPLLLNTSDTVTADIEVPQGKWEGAERESRAGH